MHKFRSSHKKYIAITRVIVANTIGIGCFFLAGAVSQQQEQGLLFYLSGSKGFKADYAAGENPEPNFLEDVKIVPNGSQGPGFECAHTQKMSYWAPGNIYAERGTLSFFWRAREPVSKTEFPIFRVGYADHSSWDMVWLRIDYNGHGFDAFVTDVNLARLRVSTTLSPFPKPDQWIHLALAWDETRGIRFYIDGKLAAQKDSVVVLYAGLDQFGPHSRIISPMQVESDYNFQRGGDIDEIRIYDRMLLDANILRLAKGKTAGEVPGFARSLKELQWQNEWWLRNGWNRKGDVPPYLDQAFNRVRKVEIQDVYDLKRWWWKGTDGIRETTWPGVYNRSRLPGRNDYFQLPDWDCYSLSGKSVMFFMPDELWNHIEISGGAWGTVSLLSEADGEKAEQALIQRPRGQEKTFYRLSKLVNGEKIEFTNVEQEMPIGELSAYYVSAGREPENMITLSYTLAGNPALLDNQLEPLVKFINGRYMQDERSTMAAVPSRVYQKTSKKGENKALPIVHVIIPYNALAGVNAGIHLDSSYAWENIHGGLDGIAIDIPPLDVHPTYNGLIPLNIQIKDPNWPMRNMLDFSFSVKPGEARTLWLDTRDRILTKGKSLYLTLAGAGQDFCSDVLEGTQVRLIFKPWKDAYREHVQDRFTQVRDNYANLVEEHIYDPRLNLYNRFVADITDLLHVSPQHYPGQNYLFDQDKKNPKPPFVQPVCSEGTPLWAFRQVEDLRYLKRFILWWIDNRQISNGELGGGLSDDDDLTNYWPGVVLMGCEQKKIGDAILRLLDTMYEQGMSTNGLSTIQTDGLHAFEEGIEALTQALLVDYGSPKQLERIMETVRALDEKIMLKNKAGHRHFRSSYFSGTKIADESVWEWALQKQEFMLLQPVLSLAMYNGNPRARQLAIDMADGLLAHARKDRNGKIILDTEINFLSDSTRPSPLGSKSMLDYNMGPGGMMNRSSSGLQLLWVVYTLTGDEKYLQPLLDLGKDMVGLVFRNVFDFLNLRDSWKKKIIEEASTPAGTDLYNHICWQMTGNKTYLENYYAKQIESMALKEYINTEGSVWSDRAVAESRELQRSRLGGIALVRGAIYSGHVISWKFNPPASDESVAILVPEATGSDVKVIVYALDAKPVEAIMTAWDIDPGKWEMIQGLDRNDDDRIDTILSKRIIDLERSKGVQLTFSPRATTILQLKLQSKSIPYWQRPDLGISSEDVEIQGNTIKVKVHSLGSVDAPATTIALMDKGKVIASAEVPALQAPIDFLPKCTEVSLTLQEITSIGNYSIQIDPNKALNEITVLNNQIDFQESELMAKKIHRKKSNDKIGSLKRKPRPEHIAFNVKDPAAVARWYCDHLGMKVVRKSPPPSDTHFIADSSMSMMFELCHNTEAPVPDYASMNHLSLHFAFIVDDLKAIRQQLLSAGAKVVEDIFDTPTGDQVLMLRDPFGLAIQFVKRASPMLKSKGVRAEHFALNVADPHSIANWYCENLGMKIIRKGGPPTDTCFVADAGSNIMIELYRNTAFPILDMNTINHYSIHMAFVVEDVRSIRNSLIGAGAQLAEDLRVTDSGDQVLMLRDPWGVPIQFIKRSKPMLE